MCCSGFSNEFDESDYFTFKPQVLQHIDFAAEDELASEPDYSHFIRMANYNDLVITRGHHDTTDSRETIFLGSLQLALSWVVWTQTHSPLWLSAIALLSALPSLPLAPVAGSMADRFHRHHILLITQTIGCVIAALTAFLSFFGYLNPYNLAVLALIFGIVTSIDGPSMHSMLVETGETVSQAVARQSLVMNVARSIAPMVAVFIIESFSATWCFAMNAICFIPMIAVMAVVKIPNRTTSEQREESVGVTSRQLFMTYPILREVLPQVACLSILVMPAVALLPAISLKGSELMSFGSMSSGLGFGAVAAAVLMQRNRLIIHHVTTVWTGGWVTCIAFAVLPALETVTSQWLCALVAGGSLTFALAAANNLVQCKAPDIYRGRFSAMYLAVMLGLVPVGQLILGFASEQFTAVVAVRACAVIAMVLMVLFAFLFSISKAEETVGPD